MPGLSTLPSAHPILAMSVPWSTRRVSVTASTLLILSITFYTSVRMASTSLLAVPLSGSSLRTCSSSFNSCDYSRRALSTSSADESAQSAIPNLT